MRSFDLAILLGYPEISGGTNVIMEHAIALTRLGHRVSIVTELPIDPQRLAWKPEAMKLPLFCHADCVGRLFDISMATWWRSVYDLPFVPARRYAYFCQSIESRFFSEQELDAKALAEYTYRQPLPVVTEASWIARYLQDNYQSEVTLVHNGIDKEVFSVDGPAIEPRPQNGLRVLVEGTLGVSFKRVEDTIRLCQQAGVPDLWLLTPSPCRSYPAVRRVFSKVPTERVGDVYRSCDVLVKLSTVEGMFGPPLEMMHCGGTAITSDVTGHDEYMRHGENGFVVARDSDMDVIRYLRMLQSDRDLLERLKAGARRTADAWPDWSHAVRGMESFVLSVIDREVSPDAMNRHMMRSLRAALHLAGPLYGAQHVEMTKQQLLRGLQGACRRYVVRRWPRLHQYSKQTWERWRYRLATRPAHVLPAIVEGKRLSAQPVYRLCCLGDPQQHGSHVPASCDRLDAMFLPVCGEISREQIAAVEVFNPDITFILRPDLLTHEILATLPGIVIAHSCERLSKAAIRRYRELFPAGDNCRAAMLHADSRAVATLAASGVQALGSFLLPVRSSCFHHPNSLEAWVNREIPLLLVSSTDGPVRDYVEVAERIPGFVHVASNSSDESVEMIVRNARMVLHLPRANDRYLDTAKAVRDMACGCLVVGGEFAEDYGLIPNEHYLSVCRPEDLAAIVRPCLRMPDTLDVMRKNAMRRAQAFDASKRYVEMIEKYFLYQAKGPGAPS